MREHHDLGFKRFARHRWSRRTRDLSLVYCREVNAYVSKVLSQTRRKAVQKLQLTILTQGKRGLPVLPRLNGQRDCIAKAEDEKLGEAFTQYEAEILRFTANSAVPFTNNRS